MPDWRATWRETARHARRVSWNRPPMLNWRRCHDMARAMRECDVPKSRRILVHFHLASGYYLAALFMTKGATPSGVTTMYRHLLALCTLTLILPSLAHAGGDVKKPNILFFLIDDLGYTDVGFNGGDIKTRNI